MGNGTHAGLSRAIIMYRPENFDAALDMFARTLGIDDFGTPVSVSAFGIRVAVSQAGGLELICPEGREGFAATAWDFIERRGEGLYGIVWRVPDLDKGERRAAAAGFPRVGERIDCFDADPVWRDHFSLAIEAGLTPVAGVEVTLIQLDPLPTSKADRER